jgi:hypothetical protein
MRGLDPRIYALPDSYEKDLDGEAKSSTRHARNSGCVLAPDAAQHVRDAPQSRGRLRRQFRIPREAVPVLRCAAIARRRRA